MNETLTIAYKILKALESGEYPPAYSLHPERLGCSHEKFGKVLKSLVDEGYIRNVKIYTDVLGTPVTDVSRAEITLKGAEYLNENSAMQKIAKFASGIIPLVGGLT